MQTLSFGIVQRLLDGVAVSVQNGTAWATVAKANLISWETQYAGTPASITAILQGSLDNSNWFTLDTSTNTAGEVRTFATAVPFLRARISAVSAGSATALNVLVNAVPYGVTVTTPGAGSGDVIGPSSSVDRALVLFDGIDGKHIQESPVIGESDGRLSNLTDPTGLQDAASKNYVDSQIAGSTPVAGASQTSFLVSGGQVIWTSLYHFTVSAALYYINGIQFQSDQTDITLDAADGSNPRLDVVAVDDTGTVVVIKGTAAATPSEPDIDPGTQLKLALVLVPAGSTAPTVSNTLLYFQNAGGPTEWNWATSGTGFNVNSSSNPLSPATKDIEGTTVNNGAYAQGTIPSSTYNPSTSAANFLFIYIRSKATWANNRGLSVSLRSSGVLKGQAVAINRSGSFGFDSSITGSYQLVAIPFSLFAIPAGTTITQIRITAFGAGHGFYLANINIQQNGATQQPTGITQDQADARYASRNALFLTSAADSTLPLSRRLAAGTGITFDDTVSGVRTVNGSAAGITALTSDVTASGSGSVAATIANDAVTNAKMANMAQSTIKGRAVSAGTGDPTDLSATQATAVLDAFVGDSGSGGTKGLVPAPASGDAAAGKFLKADGTFAVPSGGGGSAKPFIQWTALANQAPASNPATFNTRNNIAVLDFDPTTSEGAIFNGILPSGYAGGGIKVGVQYVAATGITTGTIGWLVAIDAIGNGTTDIDSDSFASDQTITAVTVPGTSGFVASTSVNIANGSAMDSLAAGQAFRLRIKRDTANDTATGDAQLIVVSMEEQ